jgi:hypothetical protein
MREEVEKKKDAEELHAMRMQNKDEVEAMPWPWSVYRRLD